MKRLIGVLLSGIILCAVGNSLAEQKEGTMWDIQCTLRVLSVKSIVEPIRPPSEPS